MRPLSISDELRSALFEIGDPSTSFEKQEYWFGHLARRCRLSPRVIRSIFYRERENPLSSTVDAVRTARDLARSKRARLQMAVEQKQAALEARTGDKADRLERLLGDVVAELDLLDPERCGPIARVLWNALRPRREGEPRRRASDLAVDTA